MVRHPLGFERRAGEIGYDRKTISPHFRMVNKLGHVVSGLEIVLVHRQHLPRRAELSIPVI
jgi:hypothetical protein